MQHAKSDRLLLLDADMLVSDGLIQRGMRVLKRGHAYFPIFRHLTREGKPARLENASYGTAFVTRAMFDAAGGVPAFKSWGGEDDIFYHRYLCRQAGPGGPGGTDMTATTSTTRWGITRAGGSVPTYRRESALFTPQKTAGATHWPKITGLWQRRASVQPVCVVNLARTHPGRVAGQSKWEMSDSIAEALNLISSLRQNPGEDPLWWSKQMSSKDVSKYPEASKRSCYILGRMLSDPSVKSVG